jgi:hypothetical protein
MVRAMTIQRVLHGSEAGERLRNEIARSDTIIW